MNKCEEYIDDIKRVVETFLWAWSPQSVLYNGEVYEVRWISDGRIAIWRDGSNKYYLTLEELNSEILSIESE